MIPLMPHEVVQKNDIELLYCQAHRLASFNIYKKNQLPVYM